MAVGFRRDGKTTEAFGIARRERLGVRPAAKPTIADYLPERRDRPLAGECGPWRIQANVQLAPIPAVRAVMTGPPESTPSGRSRDGEIVAHAPIEECFEGVRPSLMVNTARAKLPQNGRTRVRYSRFALVAILAPICGCAVSQPASTPASSSAPPTSELTVVSGERQRIDFISVLNPDCSSAGYVTVRVIAPPAHGELTTEKGIDYPTYPKDNQRYQCNLKKVPLVNVYYRSIPGYVGVDTVTIEWVSPVIPVAKNRTITIAVR